MSSYSDIHILKEVIFDERSCIIKIQSFFYLGGNIQILANIFKNMLVIYGLGI